MNRLPWAVGRVISVRSILRRWTTLHLLVDLGTANQSGSEYTSASTGRIVTFRGLSP
jgi:hypothetical protein